MKNFENFTNSYKEFRFLPYDSYDLDTNQKILILNAYNAIKKNENLFPYMQKELTSENETISLNVILLNDESENELFEFLLKIGNSFNINFYNTLFDLNYRYSDKILNNKYDLYVPSFKNVISYDFDGVLHKSIIPGTIHPKDYNDYDNFIPNFKIIEKLNKQSKNHDIIILTSRQNYEIPDLWEFVKKWDINITDIFTTGDRIKKSYVLKSLKAIKHYDDNIAIKNDVEKNGIKFVFINTNMYFCKK